MAGEFTLKAYGPRGQAMSEIYWDDKLKITREKEQGQQFFRNKIDGTVSFTGDSFDLIASASLDDDFQVIIEKVKDNQSIQIGYFRKTDVEFDYDNRIASTNLEVRDEYKNILDHLDDEIDVLSLGLPARSLTIDKRAILQLYVAGTTKVTHVVGNQSYEVDAISGAETMNGGDIQNKKFSSAGIWGQVKISSVSPALENILDIGAIFSGNYGPSSVTQDMKLTTDNGSYFRGGFNTQGAGDFFILCDSQGSPVRVESGIYEGFVGLPVYTNSVESEVSSLYLLPNLIESYPTITLGSVYISTKLLFARILCDITTDFKENENVFTLENLSNYRYVSPASANIVSQLKSNFVGSSRKSNVPTKWGISSLGDYYLRPEHTGTSPLIPVGWDSWSEESYWVQLTPELNDQLSNYDSKWTLRDAYPFVEVIRRFLEYWELDYLGIDETEFTSEFFFGDQDTIMTLFPEHRKQNLYITPVTNIEKTFYDTAARKMTLSLSDIFNMLKNCFNVYWDLYSRPGKGYSFRFEHLAFYENGGSYGSNPNIIFILQDKEQPRIRKSWASGQNKATYDVSDLPSRYEFTWSTECTDVFDGFPIQINNGYVASNSKNEINIAKFFSDVDLIMSTPDSFSDDAIVILGSTDGEKVSRQTIYHGRFPTYFDYHTQNGYLSLMYLETVYHRYLLSGDNATAEDFPGGDTGEKWDLEVQKVKRFREQTIRVPYSPSILTEQGNIQTPLGIGIPKKITYELDTCMAEIELLQEN